MKALNKQYEIRTIRDLIDAACKTQDLNGLFEDLKMCAVMCLELAAHPEINKDELFEAFSCFRWTDDGLREGKLVVKPKE